jgi:hypothetical protein
VTKTRIQTLCSTLVLTACGAGTEPLSDKLKVIEATEVVDLAIGPAIGVDKVDVPIRGVNSYAAALPNVEVTLLLEGTGLSSGNLNIQTGAWGISELRISSGTPQQVRITALDWEGETSPEGEAWLLKEMFAPQSVLKAHAFVGQSSHVEFADEILLYSVGPELYWQEQLLGSTAVKSAVLNEDITGLVSADLDNDGHPDAVAWNRNELLILRGSASGLVWGSGYTIEEGELVDVAVDEVDDNRFPDIALALSDNDNSSLEILLNDGAWGFSLLPSLGLSAPPESITIGDFLGNQNREVAILQEKRVVRYRYDASGQSWLNSGQDLKPEPSFGPGSSLGQSQDISGDGAEELFLLEAPVESGERRMSFYELPNERPLVYDLYFEAHQYHLGDVTGDGVADALILQFNEEGRGELRGLTSDSAGDDPYRNRGFASLSTVGEMGLSDSNEDGIADLNVASEAILHHPGRIPEEGFWTVDEPSIGGWDIGALSPGWIVDANNDGKKLDMLVVRSAGGKTALWSYTFGGGLNGGDLYFVRAPIFERTLDNRNANTRASFLDWDICEEAGDSYIYMLVDDSGSWLFVTKLQKNGSVPDRRDTAVRADKVACGNFKNGASLAAVSYAGEVNYFDNALEFIGTENIGPIDDVAAADTDGEGAILYSCTGSCSVASADLDGDGIDELVYSGSDETPRLEAWGQIFELGSSGIPTFNDVDGNGDLDLILTSLDSGHFEVHLVDGQSKAPPQAWHTRQALGGPVTAGDVDGDGLAEFFLLAATGDFLFASQD